VRVIVFVSAERRPLGEIGTHTPPPLRINVIQGNIMSACSLISATPAAHLAGKS